MPGPVIAGRGRRGKAGGPAIIGVVADQTTVLLILPDRADAEALADELATAGYRPARVHRDMFSGEDDAEDVDWVVELATTPDGRPAADEFDRLGALADDHDGFADLA